MASPGSPSPLIGVLMKAVTKMASQLLDTSARTLIPVAHGTGVTTSAHLNRLSARTMAASGSRSPTTGVSKASATMMASNLPDASAGTLQVRFRWNGTGIATFARPAKISARAKVKPGPAWKPIGALTASATTTVRK